MCPQSDVIIKTNYDKMKTNYCLLLLLVYLTLFSCLDKEEQNADKTQYAICLALKSDFEMHPFPRTRSIPDYRPGNPHGIEEQAQAPLFSRIEYLVYDKASGAVVKSKSFTESNSDDFGEYVYDELEAGTYRIVLLAHATSGLTCSGNEAAFSEVTDTFYATKELTVGPENEALSVDMLLRRVVGLVEFVGTKPVPEEAAGFILEIEEQYNEMNLKTGLASQSRSIKKEYPLLPGAEPGTVSLYHFYTFVPESLERDTVLLSGVKLITLDTEADTLHTIQLTSIPVMKNRITRYTGSLYAPNTFNNTLTLEVEDYGHWGDTIHVPF